jgi:ankyrin repeat protein
MNIATVAGAVPLHVAAQAGNTEMVNYLLDMGSDINAKKGDGANGMSSALFGSSSLLPRPFLLGAFGPLE